MIKTKLTTWEIVPRFKRIWAPILPYLTVGIGLFAFHSAWVAMVSYHAAMLLMILWARKEIPWQYVVGTGRFKISAVTFVLGGCGGLLLYLLWPWLAVPPNINDYLQSIGLNSTSWPYFIVYYVIFTPLLEELFWRGFLINISPRIILNDLLFAGYHMLVLGGLMGVIWLIAVFLILASSAWFWRQANRWNHGISASIASHFAADVAIILAIYFMTVR